MWRQVGVVLDELAEADVHALFVAFRDEDEVDGELAVDGLVGHQGVELGHLGALGVDGAAAYEHAGDVGQAGLRAGNDVGLKGWRDPGVGLGDGHGVVLPIDGDGFGRALVALGVDDRVAGRAVLGDADVVDAGGLAAELVEEALDHLGGLRNAFAAVRDAGLLDPLLQVLDVLVDVLVDVVEDLADLRRRGLGVGTDTAGAIGLHVQRLLGLGGALRSGLFARFTTEREQDRSSENTGFPGTLHRHLSGARFHGRPCAWAHRGSAGRGAGGKRIFAADQEHGIFRCVSGIPQLPEQARRA